jgi:acyl-CoA synthetase (AMP-forming)/AMP-acid ligase II
MNFSLAVLRRADREPDRPAVKFGQEEWNNRELATRVQALAVAFTNMGIRRGDIVALLLNNCAEFLETTFAVNLIGGVFLPLNYRLAVSEWQYILDHAGACAIVTEPSFEQAIAGISHQLPGLTHFVSLGPPRAGWHRHEDLIRANRGASVSPVEMDQADMQRLMYTSGTTARPKGVVITYGNLHWKNVAHIIEFGITSADRTLIAGPLYHVGAYDLPATGVFYAGGSLVILPRFDPLAVLAACQSERATNLWLAPSMLNAVIQAADGSYDTSSVRFVINGGEKMPAPLIQQVLKTFPNAWFADAYGLTETVSGDTFLDRDHVFSKIGSVGKPVVHLEVRILDEGDRIVSTGELGEIVLRGPKVFPGYWRDAAATAIAIRDGWFHTGDVGRIDADGFLFIEDRKKDLIISGGENVASPEVERALYEHPAVLEAAVIGIPDQRWGEVPKAFVVLKPGLTASTAELIAFCTERLAKFKVPKIVEFLDALPRNPSGKILKRQLRDHEQGRGLSEDPS